MNPDWISPWWQALVLPDRWGVCGMTVPPLSVWHVYALENIGNRFVCGGAKPDMDDAASLLLFASRTMEQGKELYWNSKAKAKAIRKIYKRLNRKPDQECLDACSEYVTECMRHGTRMKQAGGGGCTPAGSPEPWFIVSRLMHMGRTRSEAWNYTYAEARALMDVSDEAEGHTVMTPSGYGEEMLDNWDHYKDMTGTKELVLN
jgi:hypothetical protein